MGSYIAAIDYGEKRVGVALASAEAHLARPFTTLTNDGRLMEQLSHLAQEQNITTFVVGLPRNLSGEDTPQTAIVKQFAEALKSTGVTVIFQDEAVTSDLAHRELVSRGKPFKKADIDALAACYILEDYMETHTR